MPSPRKGSPVTGVVALGTGAVFGASGDWTMNAASVSMLIVAMPAVTAELGSVTNADPFQVPTMLDASMFGEVMSMVIALRNVPGYGTVNGDPDPHARYDFPAPRGRDRAEVRHRDDDLHVRGKGPRGNVDGDFGAVHGNRPDGPPGRRDGLRGDYRAEPARRQWSRHWRRYGLTARRGRGCDAGRSPRDCRAEHHHCE
jgi:hypothetical protein